MNPKLSIIIDYTCERCGKTFPAAQRSRRSYCADCIVAGVGRKPKKEVKEKEESE